MSSVSRDSGLLDCKRANDNKRKLEAALQELIEASVLMRYESDETRGGRSALKDIDFAYILIMILSLNRKDLIRLRLDQGGDVRLFCPAGREKSKSGSFTPQVSR